MLLKLFNESNSENTSTELVSTQLFLQEILGSNRRLPRACTEAKPVEKEQNKRRQARLISAGESPENTSSLQHPQLT